MGIGKATALRFAKEGAIVAIWDVNKEKAQVVVDQIIAEGGQAKFYAVNTMDEDQVTAAAAAVNADYGRIDILLNNAGITRDSSLKKMTRDQWDLVIGVNLTGVYLCAQAVVPYMEANKYGRIINASSVVGLTGNFGQTNYAATKAGVIGMSKVWGS